MIQEIFSDYFPLISHGVVRGMVVFIISLGFVYILGRMLGILNTPRSKNAFAFVMMIMLSYWSILIYDGSLMIHELEVYWRTMVYTAIASIFYVLIGFDLYDRFNAFTDKKFVKTPKKKINLKEKE